MAVTNKTIIMNKTLSILGKKGNIIDGQQNHPNYNTLNSKFDTAVEKVLSDFDWCLNSAFDTLGLVTTKSANPKYDYEYDLPNNCLVAREIVASGGVEIPEEEIERRKVDVYCGADDKQVLGSDVESPTLRYSRKLTNYNDFPVYVIGPIAYWLAFESAKEITESDKDKQMALDVYNALRGEGKVVDTAQGIKSKEETSSFIEARG